MSNIERKEKEKEFKQQMILDAAKAVFKRDGYKHSKIDDIAKESGFAKGSIYNYFKSKKEIMEEIIIQYVMLKNGELITIMKDTTHAKEKIKKVISLHYDAIVNPGASDTISYFSDVKELLLFTLEALPSLRKIEQEIIVVTANLIKSFHESHPVDCLCEFNPYTLARLFFSYGHGVMMEVMTSRLFCDDKNIEQVEKDNKKLIDQHIEFLLYSLENVHINN